MSQNALQACLLLLLRHAVCYLLLLKWVAKRQTLNGVLKPQQGKRGSVIKTYDLDRAGP